jgi:arylsulfatase A-like enzyme
MIKRVLVVTGMFWATVSIAIAEQPNVLVVMSDDQGVGDIGLAGNQWARTPVLDRLAAESAQFANIVAAPARPTPP